MNLAKISTRTVSWSNINTETLSNNPTNENLPVLTVSAYIILVYFEHSEVFFKTKRVIGVSQL